MRRQVDLVDFIVTYQPVFILLFLENMVDFIIIFQSFVFVVLYIHPTGYVCSYDWLKNWMISMSTINKVIGT